MLYFQVCSPENNHYQQEHEFIEQIILHLLKRTPYDIKNVPSIKTICIRECKQLIVLTSYTLQFIFVIFYA